MVKTTGLYHIHLEVADLDRSLRFYEDVLGMKEVFRAGSDMVFLSTPGGSDTVTLNAAPEGRERAGTSGGIAHFGFALADDQDLDEVIAEIEAGGGKLVERGEHAPGSPYIYVSDPDGYVIEL